MRRRNGPGDAEPTQRGFSFHLAGGRALLRLEREPLGRVAEIDVLEMSVPNLRLPFDITRGVEGLRNRRLALNRLQVSAGIGELVDAAAAAAGGSPVGGLAAELSPRGVTILAALGPAERRVHATFRLVPGPAGGELSFTADEARCYGPLAAPLVGAPFAVLSAVGWFDFDGVLVRPRAIVEAALRCALPTRGWRVPGSEGVVLARLDLGQTRACAEYVARGAAAAGRLPDGPGADMPWLRRCEELRAVRDGDRLLAQGDAPAARDAYARLAASDPGDPAAAARLASLDLLSEERSSAARSAIAAARDRFPGRTDLLAAAAHGSAIAGDVDGEIEALSLLLASATPLERYAASLRIGSLLFEREPARAERCFEDALAARGEDAAALAALARLAGASSERVRFDGLARRWAAATADPGERAAAHAEAGRILDGRFGDPGAAAAQLELAVAAAPGDRSLQIGLAEAAFSCGDIQRALALLDRAERGASGDGDLATAAAALEAAGRIWLRSSEPGLAAARFREALGLGAGSGELRRSIEEGLEACGAPGEVRR